MATPKFNGNPIFSSMSGSGSDATEITEGVLWLLDYGFISSKIHFEGEDGDRYLAHGWPDRQWVFKGLLSADSLDDLWSLFSGIEDAIDAANTSPTEYHELIDSFGCTYSSAQVHHFNPIDVHKTDTGGYVATVVVTGIVQGMQLEGGSE